MAKDRTAAKRQANKRAREKTEKDNTFSVPLSEDMKQKLAFICQARAGITSGVGGAKKSEPWEQDELFISWLNQAYANFVINNIHDDHANLQKQIAELNQNPELCKKCRSPGGCASIPKDQAKLLCNSLEPCALMPKISESSICGGESEVCG
jgi:hypothetical protein